MPPTPNTTDRTATPPPEKSIGNKEIGMLVMLLAAETAAGVCKDYDASAAGQPLYDDAPFVPDADYSATTSAHSPVTIAAVSVTHAPTIDPLPVKGLTTLKPAPGQKASSLDRGRKFLPKSRVVLDRVMRFMSWRDALRCGAVCQAWLAASRRIAMAVPLPLTQTPALFIPCHKDLDADKALEEQLRKAYDSRWRCAFCGFCNSETRILCGNRRCQLPPPTHLDAARLFLGQLRRSATVPYIKWLVEDVLQDEGVPLEVINVENHRHQATGRGKGCAWVYLRDRAMAPALIDRHHRVMCDVGPGGQEGVWIVRKGDEEALNDEVSRKGHNHTARRPHLPRSALVVEMPSPHYSQQAQDQEAKLQLAAQSRPMYGSAGYQTSDAFLSNSGLDSWMAGGLDSPQAFYQPVPLSPNTGARCYLPDSEAGVTYRHDPYADSVCLDDMYVACDTSSAKPSSDDDSVDALLLDVQAPVALAVA